MKPVDQMIIDCETGDCWRACIASMFEMELEQVPKFMENGHNGWEPIFDFFEKKLGYELTGMYRRIGPAKKYLINGCVCGVVKSRNFEGKNHCVLLDETGLVLHDPNPDKKFQGVNVVESGEFVGFDVLIKIRTIKE